RQKVAYGLLRSGIDHYAANADLSTYLRPVEVHRGPRTLAEFDSLPAGSARREPPPPLGQSLQNHHPTARPTGAVDRGECHRMRLADTRLDRVRKPVGEQLVRYNGRVFGV